MSKSTEVCPIHQQHIELIQEIRNDTMWIRRIGSWIGLFVLALLPFIIGMFIYMSRLSTRIEVLEYKVGSLVERKK